MICLLLAEQGAPRMIQSEFRRVADDIAAKINAGLLQPGQQLPSYRDLAAEYEVGISTVRMALVLLGERGLTIGRPGKGTFVADQGRRN